MGTCMVAGCLNPATRFAGYGWVSGLARVCSEHRDELDAIHDEQMRLLKMGPYREVTHA